ncbi:hypothetical protein [Pseudonocardia oroxyli]|uniref:hypothetical protein n=1 Tax=Pseudonocardia oroxyli TaxID=366584 RepID=UPI00115FA12A|nr:hypothetical protein [Pseudonocardia oroxyli]
MAESGADTTKPVLSEADIERLMRLPEQSRVRARAVVTLLAAVTGSLLAGLSLQATAPLPDLARWGVLVAAALIACATGICLTATILDSEEEDFDPQDAETVSGTLIERINDRIVCSLKISGLATALLLISLGFGLFNPGRPAQVTLTDPGMVKAVTSCPSITNPIGVDNIDSLRGNDPFVTITLAKSDCANGRSLDSITIPRSDIALIAEVER